MGFAAGWNAGVNMVKEREERIRGEKLRENLAKINEGIKTGAITPEQGRTATQQALFAGGEYNAGLTAQGQVDANVRQDKQQKHQGAENALDRGVQIRGQNTRRDTALSGQQVTRDVANMRNQTDLYGIGVQAANSNADRQLRRLALDDENAYKNAKMQMGDQQFWAAYDQGRLEFGEGMKVKREALQVERDKFAHQRVNDYMTMRMNMPEAERKAILARGEKINKQVRAAFASPNPENVLKVYESVNDGVDVTYGTLADGTIQLYAKRDGQEYMEPLGRPDTWENHATRAHQTYVPEEAYKMAAAEYTRTTKGQDSDIKGLGGGVIQKGERVYAPDLGTGKYEPITSGGSEAELRQRAEMVVLGNPNYNSMSPEQAEAAVQQIMQQLSTAQ